MEDVSLHVRGLENVDARRLRNKLMNQIPFQMRRAGLSVDQPDRINIRVYRDAVLLDWKGLTEDDETTPIPYSKEMAERLLANPIFREGVEYAASLVGETKDGELKGLEGNSSGA
ncbi:hypothetical protein [Hansschlegelia sp. KR7-227]|uniref:hypothetical protein n=1 Tax=Hansschlegelia sp. KR7-227 TaxID=3400914 RepID=UPI003C0BD36E